MDAVKQVLTCNLINVVTLTAHNQMNIHVHTFNSIIAHFSLMVMMFTAVENMRYLLAGFE